MNHSGGIRAYTHLLLKFIKTPVAAQQTSLMLSSGLFIDDYVVVINAHKVVFTGNKLRDKTYEWYTGYMGGLKSLTAQELLQRKPEEIIKKAVKGMLPKNKLADALIKKLKVYASAEHPHQAQIAKEDALVI